MTIPISLEEAERMRKTMLETVKKNIESMNIEDLKMFCYELVEENEELSSMLMQAIKRFEPKRDQAK